MKKRKYFLSALLASACLFTFPACSDSDDDEGGSIPSKGVALYNGKLITNVGSTWFKYDENNRCTSFGDNRYDNHTIDYTTGIIYDNDNDDNFSVSFNSKCQITKYQYSYKANNDEETESATFSYDASGHLTSITGKSKYVEYEGSGKYEDIVGNGTAKLQWKNGNLVKIIITEECKDNDGGYEKNIDEITIKYNTEENIWLQPVGSILENVLPSDVYNLVHVGMFGVGPANFPVSVYVKRTSTYNEDGELNTETSENNYEISVRTNVDGTIDNVYDQSLYSSNLKYSYNFANDDTYGTRAAIQSPTDRIFKKHGLFKHRKRHIRDNK